MPVEAHDGASSLPITSGARRECRAENKCVPPGAQNPTSPPFPINHDKRTDGTAIEAYCRPCFALLYTFGPPTLPRSLITQATSLASNPLVPSSGSAPVNFFTLEALCLSSAIPYQRLLPSSPQSHAQRIMNGGPGSSKFKDFSKEDRANTEFKDIVATAFAEAPDFTKETQQTQSAASLAMSIPEIVSNIQQFLTAETLFHFRNLNRIWFWQTRLARLPWHASADITRMYVEMTPKTVYILQTYVAQYDIPKDGSHGSVDTASQKSRASLPTYVGDLQTYQRSNIVSNLFVKSWHLGTQEQGAIAAGEQPAQVQGGSDTDGPPFRTFVSGQPSSAEGPPRFPPKEWTLAAEVFFYKSSAETAMDGAIKRVQAMCVNLGQECRVLEKSDYGDSATGLWNVTTEEEYVWSVVPAAIDGRYTPTPTSQ